MCGLRGLFNGLAYTSDGTTASFSKGTGDVRGLLSRELKVGDDVKKFGGLELGTGEDGNRAGASHKDFIEQPLVKLGELGGRGDVGPGDDTDTGLVKTGAFDCSSEKLPAHGAGVS